MNYESVLNDSAFELELEQIKTKIGKLYSDLAIKVYRQSNPAASQKDIDFFLESNALEFKGVGFDEEAEHLESMLDMMMQEADIDEVSDRDYYKADVESGAELKSKSKDKNTTPFTEALKKYKGGLFTPDDLRKKTFTQALKTPRGNIKRVIDDHPEMDLKSLKDIWDAEREKLLALVRRRNKEHGVKFW